MVQPLHTTRHVLASTRRILEGVFAGRQIYVEWTEAVARLKRDFVALLNPKPPPVALELVV
jgi:hypothetical protein